MEISPSRQSLHTFEISVSLFPLDTVLSTLESDSLPRTSFRAHHKSALSHEFITLDDASSWLPLADENQRHRRAYFSLLGEQWWCRPSHFFHIRGFGGCDCGGEVVVVGVEAVSPRGVVDRRVLTAGIDGGIGLRDLWEGCVRPGGHTEILRAEWRRGSPDCSHGPCCRCGPEESEVAWNKRKEMGQAHPGVFDGTCCEWMTFKMHKRATHPRLEPHAGACDDLWTSAPHWEKCAFDRVFCLHQPCEEAVRTAKWSWTQRPGLTSQEINEAAAKRCERGVVDKRVRLLIRGSAQGTSLRTDPHWKWRWRSGGWSRRWERLWRVQSGESQRIKNAQPHETWMGWHAHYALSQCHVRHCYECRETWENVTCEGVLFTLPVSCSRLPSAVNDLATTNLKKELHQWSFHCHHEVLDEEDDECHFWYW